MDKISEEIKRQAADQKLEELASQRAAGTANPGPLARVFAPQKNIVFGNHVIRPFYDVDFEYLQMLDHPYATCAVGETKEIAEWIPRGPKAWEFFWLMTTPILEVEAAFEQGVPHVKKLARQKFGQCVLGELFDLYKPVVEQYVVYASSVVGYGAADSGADKDKAKSNPPSAPA